MSAPDVVYCMLTVLFVAASIHGLRQGLLRQESGWRSRVDHLLHAAMALAMAAMPWSWGRALPLMPQTAFLRCCRAVVLFDRSQSPPGIEKDYDRQEYAGGSRHGCDGLDVPLHGELLARWAYGAPSRAFRPPGRGIRGR
ncbi:hypothetical protein EES45_33285 [Streptomyces sp. ADI97-07]|nr:hypothetical protein EES45_33285 [Streptomyces sp. ADI97-07]